MQAKATANIKIGAGYEFIRHLQFIDNYKDDIPTNITGWEFQGYVVPEGEAAVDFSVVIDDAINGLITISMPAVGTATLPKGRNAWYLLVKYYAEATPEVFIEGIAVVDTEVPLWR